MNVVDGGQESDGEPEPWTALLLDPRPVDKTFSGTAPLLEDVVLRAVTLERRASGPLALVTLQWPNVPATAPLKWATADSLRIRLIFHSVTTLQVSGWPSEEGGCFVLSRQSNGIAADLTGGPVRLSLQAGLVGVDGFEAQP